MRQRYREGQEDQLGALGLVLNAVVLWNTRYTDAALTQLREQGYPVLDADAARLSQFDDAHQRPRTVRLQPTNGRRSTAACVTLANRLQRADASPAGGGSVMADQEKAFDASVSDPLATRNLSA